MTHVRSASVPSAALLGGWAPRDIVPHYTCLACGAGPDEPCKIAYPCLKPTSTDGEATMCHRLAGHDGDCSDWAPDECLVEGCACTEQENADD